MGSTSWSSTAYKNLTDNYSNKKADQIFPNKVIDNKMDTSKITIRESRDSDKYPTTIPIIVMLDVTGSMGQIPENLIKNKLDKLMETLINHDVKGAQVLFGAIGDHISDKYPIQVGQFEAGTDELNRDITSIVIEGCGGGTNHESYHLAWFFGSRMTSIDSFEKRGKKGFIFTIGDEFVHPEISKGDLKQYFNYDSEVSLTKEQLLEEANEMYHVFHIHINETYTGRNPQIKQKWKDLMGEKVLFLEDSDFVAELIATTVAVINGADIDDVVSGFNDANVVSTALATFKSNSSLTRNNTTGVMKL